MAYPIFEGSEKRLEVDFLLNDTSPAQGLRCLARQQLDGLLEKVKFCLNRELTIPVDERFPLTHTEHSRYQLCVSAGRL